MDKREDIIDKAKQYKHLVVKSNLLKGIEQVYLFGSYIKGTPNKDSDIDVAFVVNRNNIKEIAFNPIDNKSDIYITVFVGRAFNERAEKIHLFNIFQQIALYNQVFVLLCLVYNIFSFIHCCKV
jgi:predicted nucleotidyltransferase